MRVSFKQVLYYLAWLTFISCVLAAIYLPKVLIFYVGDQLWEVVGFLYVTFIPFFPLLWSVIRLSQMLRVGEPFSNLSLVHLKRISICAFSDCLFYIGGTIYFKEFICLLMVIVTLLVSLIGLIILELIKNGIVLKEENELTI